MDNYNKRIQILTNVQREQKYSLFILIIGIYIINLILSPIHNEY